MGNHSKTILITGITGFTGVYLKKHLEDKGFHVVGFSNSKSNDPSIYHCDLTQYDQVEAIITKLSPDYIVHLAAISFVQHPVALDFYAVNVLGTQHVLKACLQLTKPITKILLASSATVYGNQLGTEYHEMMLPNPVNHYGISKLAMEQVGKMFWDQLPIVIVRPFNYTAPGQEKHFVIPKIASAFTSKAPQLELGNLDVYREYNSVNFVVEVYERLLFSSVNQEIVNVCSGKMHSLHEILDTFTQITGHQLDITINPQFVRSNEIKYLCGSVQKLKQLIELPTNNDLKELLTSFVE
jgi:nucleoside-diphosphate-sugar epimerase